LEASWKPVYHRHDRTIGAHLNDAYGAGINPEPKQLPVKSYPDLSRIVANLGKFELVTVTPSLFGPDVWRYRLRVNDGTASIANSSFGL
jgi:hypothetical protein